MNKLVELVITVPEPFGAELPYKTQTRTTLGVLTQLMARAKKKIVLAAPFIQIERSLVNGPIADALQAAIKREVGIDFVSTGQSLQALRQLDWLKSSHNGVRFFRSTTNINHEERLGLMPNFA
ncbi:hypothetical protein JT359_17270 [Candidatus Poribacteria bacterium]|nr:hypothetical protein [Candidatus Poribacteria bacterium]